MMTAEKEGLNEFVKYENSISKNKNWLFSVIQKQPEASLNQIDYRFFLESKIRRIIDEKALSDSYKIISYNSLLRVLIIFIKHHNKHVFW